MAERDSVTYVAVKGEMENDEDLEESINGWRESLKGSESPGLVRAYRLPFDENGLPSYNAKNQVRLGSWAIDHYTFDELCGMIVKEFMFPNEKQMAVRLTGTRQGQRGIEFNKIVMLQRPRSSAVDPASTPESMSAIMKAITDSNERTLRMVQEMRSPAGNIPAETQQNQMTAMMQMAGMMRVMMEPMTAMMAPMMQLIAGRPGSSESPTGMLKGLVETMAVLDGLRGGQGMGVGKEGGDSAASIFRSVADVAAPLLTIAARSQNTPSAGHSRRALPNPNAPPTPAPGARVTAQAAGSAAPVTPPVGGLHPAQGVDLSRPSQPAAVPPAGADLSQPSQPKGNEGMFIQAKMIVDSLVNAAAQGVNPKEMAQSFFENTMLSMEDSMYELLCNQLEADNFLDQLSMVNSQVKTHGVFFNALRNELLTLIRQESEAAEEDDERQSHNE